MKTSPTLFFVSHPEVRIEPERPVTDWELSAAGRARAKTFAESTVLSRVAQLWSSAERKAIETAEILAAPRGLEVTSDPRLGENDRSASGFLPPEQFEEAAEAFFAQPDISFRGWERAVDAQARIVAAVQDIVDWHIGGDLAIVSHGAVGTLLWCHLMGLPINRRHDQPSQGHYWYADLPTLRPETGWRPIG